MSGSKGRILCTEDDPDTRELLVLTLELWGYQVACVGSAIDAIALIKAGGFDLLLLDNWMPEISGESLCQQIREFDSKTPILFYSGAAFPNDKERAHAVGAQGYLVKPATADELIAEVGRIIESHNCRESQGT